MVAKKFKVRAGNTITLGPEKEGGPVRVFRAGQMAPLTEEEAAEMPWAVDTGDGKTLRQRRDEAMETLRAIEEEERSANKRARTKRGAAAKDAQRDAALESIRTRPDNAASGLPSFGKIPDASVADLELAEEMAAEGIDPDDDEAVSHGFGREGAALGTAAVPVPPMPSVPSEGEAGASKGKSR